MGFFASLYLYRSTCSTPGTVSQHAAPITEMNTRCNCEARQRRCNDIGRYTATFHQVCCSLGSQATVEHLSLVSDMPR